MKKMKKLILKIIPNFYNKIKSLYWSKSTINMKEKKLKNIYYEKTGNKLDLNNPKRFTEKIQFFKLYCTNQKITTLCDKYLVRDWVKKRIGNEYLIPLLGVWNNANDINFDKLPNRFVLKTNHGSGTVIIVEDKNKIDINKIKQKLNSWLKINFAYSNTLELQYKNIKPLIIAEKFIIDSKKNDLPDYKFFCFDGKVFCSYTMINYQLKHDNAQCGYFDKDYNLLPYYRKDYMKIDKQLKKPKNYDKMISIAEKLSKGFSHVRVDLYNVDGKIYFGEMTFTTDSGFTRFEPDYFDYYLGEQWDLKNNKGDKK